MGFAQGEPPATKGGIAVKVEVTSQRFCLGPPTYGFMLEPVSKRAVTLRLKLRVSYRNISSVPIIFSRSVAGEDIVITQRIKDAPAKSGSPVIQTRRRKLPYGLEDREYLESIPPPSPPFTVLAPASVGEWQYISNEDIGILVHDPQNRRPEAEFLGKRIFVQLELDHKLIPDEIAAEVKGKWRSFGVYWAESIRTSPIELLIPLSPRTSGCESEFQID